jgi:uncharacterized protein (UPF0335 family)
MSNQRLLSLVERIERLEEERKKLADDIKDIKSEAKSAGFDVKIINQMIRERKMTDSERDEHLALAEVYRAALGMLNGTPLGDFARKRFKGDDEEPEERKPEKAVAKAKPPAEPPTPEQIAEARIEGGKAAEAGEKITANKYPAGDPRRAAWDEGWCAAAGSDGMEIPPAFRRKPKDKKPDEGKPEGGKG